MIEATALAAPFASAFLPSVPASDFGIKLAPRGRQVPDQCVALAGPRRPDAAHGAVLVLAPIPVAAAAPDTAPVSRVIAKRIERHISIEQAMREGSRIVRAIAKKYARRVFCVDVADLVQEGFVALLRAAETWRNDGGASFVTYAYRAVDVSCRHAAEIERARGLTPKNGYRFGAAARKLESMDLELAHDSEEGTTLHDFIGVTTAPEEAIHLARAIEAGVAKVEPRERGRAITYNGRSMSLWKWSQELGVVYIVLYNRVVVKGWGAVRAFETPIAKRQGGRPSRPVRAVAS